MASAEDDRRRSTGNARGGSGPASDVHRLSRTGTSLYELLDLPKNSTNQDIKKKYRKLALKYHPDKNPNNPDAEEMFKKINHAHSILSDEKKREVYDKYGSFGLYIAEQFGDEVVGHIMLFSSKWFQCFFWSCCLLTGCYFGFCLCCCCCFCCGKCKPDVDEDGEVPDVAEFEGEAEDEEKGHKADDVITVQPTSNGASKENASDPEPRPSSAAIPLPPPGSTIVVMEEPNETTALNSSGEKAKYTAGGSTSPLGSPNSPSS